MTDWVLVTGGTGFKDRVKADHAPAKLGEIRSSAADTRKATKQLGFKPMVSFDDRIGHTVQGSVENAGK